MARTAQMIKAFMAVVEFKKKNNKKTNYQSVFLLNISNGLRRLRTVKCPAR